MKNTEKKGNLKNLKNGKMLQKNRNSTKNVDSNAMLLNVIKNEILSVDIKGQSQQFSWDQYDWYSY